MPGECYITGQSNFITLCVLFYLFQIQLAYNLKKTGLNQSCSKEWPQYQPAINKMVFQIERQTKYYCWGKPTSLLNRRWDDDVLN